MERKCFLFVNTLLQREKRELVEVFHKFMTCLRCISENFDLTLNL